MQVAPVRYCPVGHGSGSQVVPSKVYPVLQLWQVVRLVQVAHSGAQSEELLISRKEKTLLEQVVELDVGG